jgi:hypothetical protein
VPPVVIQCVHKVLSGFLIIVARKQIELVTSGLLQIIMKLRMFFTDFSRSRHGLPL